MSDRVLLVDGDRSLCGRVAGFLEGAGYPTTATHSGLDALRVARDLRPRLALVEVVLPGISGYEVCRELRNEFGPAIVVILASRERVESYDRVAGLLIGADDYLVKPFALDELLARIRSLLRRPGGAAGAGLTHREREILDLLAQGHDQSAIASRLFISSKTVATHIDHILAKLGVHSRAEAVARAYRDHFVGT